MIFCDDEYVPGQAVKDEQKHPLLPDFVRC